MTTLPNGNVIVSDAKGNGFIELQDPTGNCTAAPYAGNTQKTLDTDITQGVANPGDVDGPGASAKFLGIGIAFADAQGNVYFDDPGNQKIKKIASDAAHTVSTVYKYGPANPSPVITAMTSVNGKVYVVGSDIANDFLWEIDPAGPSQKTVFTGRGDRYPELDSSQTANVVAMTTDGQSLIIGANKGYIWRIGTDGKYQATLAGVGAIVDYPQLDLKNPITNDKLPLKPPGVNQGSMVRIGSDVLWAGENGPGSHVWALHCQ